MSELAEITSKLDLLLKEVKKATARPSAWLSMREAQAYLGVSRATLDRRIAEGTLHVSRLDGGEKGKWALRFRKADLDALLIRVGETKKTGKKGRKGGYLCAI